MCVGVKVGRVPGYLLVSDTDDGWSFNLANEMRAKERKVKSMPVRDFVKCRSWAASLLCFGSATSRTGVNL